ncbi:MAG: c-type cytochrome [Pirellulaceae bacterium]|nr:c-type cytochrome [Pirellulaceae bacterium]
MVNSLIVWGARIVCVARWLAIVLSALYVSPMAQAAQTASGEADGQSDQYRGADEPTIPASIFGQGVRETPWLSPTDEAAKFRLPPGFSAELVAAEPQIDKPLNMAFDHRGRLWVTCTREYPYAAPEGTTPRDSIKIIEDTTGDGQFDTVKTFADQLNIPMGLLPVADGVICFNLPWVWHLQDNDGDDRVDHHHKLLGPFDTSRDTHGMINALRQGSDGWIYACHGFSNRSEVTAADGSRVQMHSGNTFRFRADGSRIELYTAGQVNPFGMTCDQWGGWYTADCHSKPLTALLPGGCYPSFGRPHDGLGFAPSMMDHLHASTAISGVEYYQADQFPPAYRQLFYSGNVMTSRINCNAPVRTGATVTARELADFMTSDDPWFRPVDIRLGPDGCLYVADFYNKIIGHYEVPLEHPERDRLSGRIWRIRYQTSAAVETRSPELPHKSSGLASKNHQVRRQAIEAELIRPAYSRTELEKISTDAAGPTRLRLSAVEILHRRHQLPVSMILDLIHGSDSPNASNQLIALLLTIANGWSEQPDGMPELLAETTKLLQHNEPQVVVRAIELLGRRGHPSHIEPLIGTGLATAASDPVQLQAARIAIRNILQRNDGATGQLFDRWMKDAQWLKSDQAWFVAQLLPGIANSEAAETLLRYLSAVHQISHTPSSPAAVHELTVAAIEHAARHPSQELLDLLLSMTTHVAGNDLIERAKMIDRIAVEFQSRLGQHPPALQTYLQAVLQELVGSLASHLNIHGPGMQWLDLSGSSWSLETRQCADGTAAELLSSLSRGEAYVGTLSSEPFTCPGQMSFWLAGHNGFPDKPDHQLNRVRLILPTTGRVLAQAYPPRNDRAVEVKWDLTDAAGQSVVLQVVDGDSGGAFAWVAIGRFSEPSLDSQNADRWTTAIASLLRRGSTQPATMQQLDSLTLSPRQRAGLLSAAWEGQGKSLASTLVSQALAIGRADLVAGHLGSGEGLSDELGLVIAQQISQSATAAQQSILARSLLKSADGCQILAELLEAGLLNPASLRGVSALLPQSLSPEKRQRLQRFIDSAHQSGLDPSLVSQRLSSIDWTQTDAHRGQQVFKQHCANCHQLRGEGTVIGPQLDGAIARGPERLAEDVLLPNLNVDRAFRVTTLLLDDGSIVSGQVRQEDALSVQLVGSDAKPLAVAVADIVQRRETDQSLMPANFSELLSAQQLGDLLQYLSHAAEK